MLPLKKGDRVRITGIMDDPQPLPVGAEGTIQCVNPAAGQIVVQWDPVVGSSLILLTGDPFEVV